jgi:hypothetical protein
MATRSLNSTLHNKIHFRFTQGILVFSRAATTSWTKSNVDRRLTWQLGL